MRSADLPALPHDTRSEPATRGLTAGSDDITRSGSGRWGNVSYWLIVAGAVAALVTIRLGMHHLRSGTLVLAGVLLAAALARLVLPDRRAGMLSSRRWWLDAAIFAVFGISLLLTGLAVPGSG